MVSEAWINLTDADLYNIAGYKNCHVKRPCGSVGGVAAIYVNNDLSAKILELCIGMSMLRYVYSGAVPNAVNWYRQRPR